MRDFHLTVLSDDWRESYLKELKSLIHNLPIYSNTSLNDAYLLTPSQARDFLESDQMKDWVKIKESEQKLQVGIAERLNGVISATGVVVKAIGSLANVLAKRR